MSRRHTIAARFGGLVVVASLLSGCIKAELDLTIAPDNTASGSATFAIDKRLLQLTGQSVDDLLRDADVTAPGGAENVSTEPYEDDRFVGQTVTFEGASLSELNASGEAGDLDIVRKGDEFHVSGVLDLSLAGQAGSGDPQLDDVASRAMETAEIGIRITFPGNVISANGDIDGNSVTWRPKMGESTEIRAVGSAVSTSSSPVTWILVGVALLVTIGAGVVVVSRRGARARAAAQTEEVTPSSGQAEGLAEPSRAESADALPLPPVPTWREDD